MFVPNVINITFQLGWILTLLARSVYHLYIARFLLGIAAGAIYVLIPLFVSEISEDRLINLYFQ